MRIIGIDPGMKGALALIDTELCTLAVIDMPVEAATKSRMLTSPSGVAKALHDTAPDALFLEEVGVQPGEGAVGAFSFGRGVGRIEGCAAGAMVSLWPIKPQEWKSRMNVPKDKVQAVTRAVQLFPSAASAFKGPRGGMKDGRAEAALIALFGCIKLGCTPSKPLSLVEFPGA